jgi:hypothetical protein
VEVLPQTLVLPRQRGIHLLPLERAAHRRLDLGKKIRTIRGEIGTTFSQISGRIVTRSLKLILLSQILIIIVEGRVYFQLINVGLNALPRTPTVQGCRASAGCRSCKRALAARFVLRKVQEVTRDLNSAIAVVEYNQSARAHDGASRSQRIIVNREVKRTSGQATAGRSAGLHGLEFLAAEYSAADTRPLARELVVTVKPPNRQEYRLSLDQQPPVFTSAIFGGYETAEVYCQLSDDEREYVRGGTLRIHGESGASGRASWCGGQGGENP